MINLIQSYLILLYEVFMSEDKPCHWGFSAWEYEMLPSLCLLVEIYDLPRGDGGFLVGLSAWFAENRFSKVSKGVKNKHRPLSDTYR